MPAHEMRLHPAPFEQIQNGSKNLEIRINDAKRRLIQPGDTILLLKRPDFTQQVSVRVKARHESANFNELFKQFPEHKTDMSAYYSPADEQKWGVVGLEFEVLDETR